MPPPETESAGEGRGDAPASEDLTAERMEELVENTAAVRPLLTRYIRATFKPGVHYGVIPVDAQTTSEPTLLKAGAEMVCLLFGWRARFTADLPVLQMYGPGITGTFALVCELIDRQGQVVGQGRGVAELRETSLTSANMAVKMAEKRAYVDAVLHAAGLSQYFTQDWHWRVWSIEPVRLDDDRVVPMVLVEERQTGSFHLVPTREEWMQLQAGHRRGFRTRN